jgi:hypothetical protein
MIRPTMGISNSRERAPLYPALAKTIQLHMMANIKTTRLIKRGINMAASIAEPAVDES